MKFCFVFVFIFFKSQYWLYYFQLGSFCTVRNVRIIGDSLAPIAEKALGSTGRPVVCYVPRQDGVVVMIDRSQARGMFLVLMILCMAYVSNNNETTIIMLAELH